VPPVHVCRSTRGRLLPREHHKEKDPLAALARLLEQDEPFCALSRSQEDKSLDLLVGRLEGVTPSQTTPVPEWNHGTSVPPHWGDKLDAVPSGKIEPSSTHAFCDAQDRHDAEYLKRRRAGIQAWVVAFLAVMGTAGAFGYFTWSGGARNRAQESVIQSHRSVDQEREHKRQQLASPHERNVSADAPAPADDTPTELETVPSRPLRPLTPGVIYGVRSNAVSSPEVTDPPIAAGAQRMRSETATAAANLSVGDPFEPLLPSASSAAPIATEEPLTAAISGQASPGLTAKSPSPERDPPRGESVAAGGYLVQLSSQRSDEAARATAQALELKHPNVFGGHHPFIRRSDFGARGVFFRVLVGTFANAEEAKQLCSNLKKAGGDCVVQKN